MNVREKRLVFFFLGFWCEKNPWKNRKKEYENYDKKEK